MAHFLFVDESGYDAGESPYGVLAGNRTEVQAPDGKPLEAILARVQKRAAWITKQLRYFEQFQLNVYLRAVVQQLLEDLPRRYYARVAIAEQDHVPHRIPGDMLQIE